MVRAKLKIVKDLKEKLKGADELILATDEDREGESISWHLMEVLAPKVPIKRMVFHEITKSAIDSALLETRSVDIDLVRAQEARRILDRLVGYTISPLLWKKVAYGLSAGRVQSVSVRLVSEREHERIRFKKANYWGVSSELKKDKLGFEAKLITYKKKRIAIGKDFDAETGNLLKDKKSELMHLNEEKSKAIKKELKNKKWLVHEMVKKPVSRKPAPPFITSTLQQEAKRKLNMSSKETMEVAQKLYERGMITYMRTDSIALSTQAIEASRECITQLYGKKYLPKEPREFGKKKVKGAQEAHEAIRPAGTEFIKPEDTSLSGAQLRLFELIWKRTVASQMVNSEHMQVTIKFNVGDAIFSASGMSIEFPGFLKAYVEGSDDPNAELDNREVHLPKLKKGDEVSCDSINIKEHETKPPARFTEASLVQYLEIAGIGRPSTYAAIISTIQDRGYVQKVGNALVPTFTALVVSKLLNEHLPDYVDISFTSGMEKALDDIANGDLEYVKYLHSVYFGKTGLQAQVARQEKEINPELSRSIELEGLKGLSFRIGRYGAYVCRTEKNGEEVCASLSLKHFPGDITSADANKLIEQKINGTDALGKDPESGLPVYVLAGRYGPYVQRGDSEGSSAETKPKRMAIPPMFEPDDLTMKEALQLLELPKVLGSHPDSEKDVKVGLGRFGPYVVHEGDYRSVPKTENLFDVNLARALELLATPKKMRGRAVSLKDLGKHPDLNEAINVFNGKYGPYVKCGKINVSIPEDQKPEDVTLEQALSLLQTKLGDKGKTKKKKKSLKKKSIKSSPKAKNTKSKKKKMRMTASASDGVL